MKKIAEIALGIVTSVGGFLEIGSIVTAAQAGALFGYQLLWAVALGGLCIAFLVEMSGRFAAVSKHTVLAAVRERFGFIVFVVLLGVVGLVSALMLGAEIGGACIAIELLTGIRFQVWAVVVAALTWLLLWRGRFGVIEKGVSLLGLVTVAFIVAAFKLGPDWNEAARSLLPSLPSHDSARYWFIAVSILGASVTPYLFYFYSSGAIEDKWNSDYLGTNRVVAAGGMGFGTLISMGVLVVAAVVFLPRGIQVDHYDQLALILTEPLGRVGFYLLAAGLFISCLGAALEISLAIAYMVAQGFGWGWGQDHPPMKEARFSLTYTVVLALVGLVMLSGIDPIKLTIFGVALTALSLPIAIGPFLVLMNDPRYMREHANRRVGNSFVVAIVAFSFVLAAVTIPLQIFGR
jgi:Mn2+/Fe2+ NRAMP family transporter